MYIQAILILCKMLRIILIMHYIKNLNFSDKLIKYFYNPIENEEYLYILNCCVIYKIGRASCRERE